MWLSNRSNEFIEVKGEFKSSRKTKVVIQDLAKLELEIQSMEFSSEWQLYPERDSEKEVKKLVFLSSTEDEEEQQFSEDTDHHF